MRINFDMDGTIANLYATPNWLKMLQNEDTTPYAIAKPLIRMSALAKRLNNLQKKGIEIAIISWLSKNGTEEYNKAVTETKLEWLRKHLPSVKWDCITIVAYGTPKQNFCHNENDILFDDEEPNRANWNGVAYGVENILGVLGEI